MLALAKKWQTIIGTAEGILRSIMQIWCDTVILQVIQGVASGAHLPIPGDAPPVVRDLLARCFIADPAERPTMQQIADALAAIVPPPLSVFSPVSPPRSTKRSINSERRRKAARRSEKKVDDSSREIQLENISMPLISNATV